ncbi:hypothetical protein TNCV_2713901 [Trichonephila clavipes]|nr:hypothetical protein TNCV_2713901 [Trichonephila clavipes]
MAKITDYSVGGRKERSRQRGDWLFPDKSFVLLGVSLKQVMETVPRENKAQCTEERYCSETIDQHEMSSSSDRSTVKQR